MKRLLVVFFLALMTPSFSQIYDRVGSYHDGLALASGYTSANGYSKKYGYVNEYNKLVIPLKYEHANDFSGGTAIVGMGIKYGVINRNDQTVIPIKYDGVARFVAGDGTMLFVVRVNDELGCMDKNGKLMIPLGYSCYSPVGVDANFLANRTQYIAMQTGSYPNEKWYLFDPHNGKPVLPQGGYLRANFDRFAIKEGEWYRGPSSISPINNYEIDGKIGLYDFVNGRVLVGPTYSTIEARSSGKYFIVGDGTHKGVMDNTGKMIIPMEYESISFGTDNKFLSIEVKKDGKIGYYDGEGNVLTPLGTVEQSVGHDYQLLSYNGKYGLKKYSKWLLFMDYDTIFFGGNAVSMKKDGKYGLVTLMSLEEKMPNWTELLHFDDVIFVEKYGYLIKKDGKWGVNSENPPFQFDSIVCDNNGFLVKQSGKWGICPDYRDKGKTVVCYDSKPVYLASDFFSGCVLYHVMKNGNAGIVTKENNAVVPCEYDDVMYLDFKNTGGNFFRAHFALKQNGKWALCEDVFAERPNEIPKLNVSEFDFDEILKGSNNIYPMRIGEKWGYVYWGNDGRGRRVAIRIKPKYDAVGSFIDKKALVKQGNKEFYIDRDGKKVK